LIGSLGLPVSLAEAGVTMPVVDRLLGLIPADWAAVVRAAQ
jgi:hypothetical protein